MELRDSNRRREERNLSFHQLLMDRFGPSPANSGSQLSPSPSLGTQVEDETAKPSASADVVDVHDVPDVPDVHAAPASYTTASRPAAPASRQTIKNEEVREITPSRGDMRGTRGGVSRTMKDLKTLAPQWDSKLYIMSTSPMPTEHLVSQAFPSLVSSTHVENYNSFDCNKLMEPNVLGARAAVRSPKGLAGKRPRSIAEGAIRDSS